MALLAYLKSLFILQLLMGFVFVVSGLIINFIQLCTCVLWPINKQLYRRINCRLSYSLWSREYTLLSHLSKGQSCCRGTSDFKNAGLVAPLKWRMKCCNSFIFAELVMMLEWWSGTDCTLYTDQATADMFGKEHVIIILNHNFEIDFLCGWTICERFGVLGVRNRDNDIELSAYCRRELHDIVTLTTSI